MKSNLYMVIYCNKCGQENPDDSKYCSKCGALIKDYEKDKVQPVEKKVDDIEKGNKPKSKILNYVAYGVIIICVLIILLVPTKTVYETKQESYISYESYTVQEPYLKEEIYETQELTEEQDCFDYEVKFDTELKIDELQNGYYNFSCSWNIKEISIDMIKSKNINFYGTTERSIYTTPKIIQYNINSGEILNSFTSEDEFNSPLLPFRIYRSSAGIDYSSLNEIIFDNGLVKFEDFYQEGSEWKCEIYDSLTYTSKPTITLCEDKSVLKPVNQTRKVTAYKDVTKQRPVTKYRDIEVAKKVNWILGVSLFWNN